MKKLLSSLLICVFLFSACADELVVDGKTYESKGLATQDEKDPCVTYRVVPGNIFWGIVLLETLAAPIYFFGWSLYEPVGPKNCDQPAQPRAATNRPL